MHQVFAQFSNAQDELIAVFGDVNVPLTISAGTSFRTPLRILPGRWRRGFVAFARRRASSDIQSLGMEAALLAFEGGNNLALNAWRSMWFVYPGSNWGAPMTRARLARPVRV